MWPRHHDAHHAERPGPCVTWRQEHMTSTDKAANEQIKSTESDIALECAQSLIERGAVLNACTTDGDGTTISTLQQGLLKNAVQRYYGPTEIVRNQNDMRHTTCCTKYLLHDLFPFSFLR